MESATKKKKHKSDKSYLDNIFTYYLTERRIMLIIKIKILLQDQKQLKLWQC